MEKWFFDARVPRLRSHPSAMLIAMLSAARMAWSFMWDRPVGQEMPATEWLTSTASR